MEHFSLALGGWAARGLAHIGVIQYLEEQGLRACEISGTSMGAIVAALYAFGKTSTEMRKICAEVSYMKLIDVDLKKWIIKGGKIRDFFSDIFGNTRIEELQMSLKIIATNIQTGERHVFESGLVVDAIRASVSIPGVIMPYKLDQEEWVDGGIINNLPIEVLSGKNVIAVSVLKDIARPLDAQFKALGFTMSQNFFGMGYQILQKSLEIMVKQNEDRSLQSDKAIVHIHPKFPGIDYYEFHKHERIIKIGYDAAKNAHILDEMHEKFMGKRNSASSAVPLPPMPLL